MKLYTKAKCRNCGRSFIASVSEIEYTKKEILKTNAISNITCSLALHDCYNDDETEDNGIVGIADVIGVIFREE